MSDINETAAEVLRMVGQMEASCPLQPWQVGLSNNPDPPLPFIAEVGMGDVIVSGVCDENMGEFIVLCCTAAPALAREVQRLQAELKRCRPSCVVCGGYVHSDRFCGDACYHKHYARLEEDDDAE